MNFLIRLYHLVGSTEVSTYTQYIIL